MKNIITILTIAFSNMLFSQIEVEIGDTLEMTKEVKREYIGEYIDGKVIKKEDGTKFLILSKVKKSSEVFVLKKPVDSNSVENLRASILIDTILTVDNVIMHNGNILKGTVTEITESGVKFKYENEEVINTLSKNVVAEIVFKSRRTQTISEKVVIKGESDWEKVQITNVESDITGLNKYGELMAKANSGWSTTNVGKMEKEAMEKLKREAASNGCHIVLLLTTTSRNGTYGISGGTKASVTGIAYKY